MTIFKNLLNSNPTQLYLSGILTPSRILTGFLIAGLMNILLFTGFIATTETTQTDVGTIQGKFYVNANGASTYDIPIKVPPGTAGMQPHLSLNYDSQGLNGIMGMGWSLEGLSVIERTGANFNLDGFKGGINFDENDRFSLDGERLINMDANTSDHPYYTDGAIYHTVKESWVKIQAVGSASVNGIAYPESFVLQHKNGTTYTYEKSVIIWNFIGYVNGYPQYVEANILKWVLSKVEDLNGNSMTISYENDGYQALPQLISYTANEGQGLISKRFVTFTYESRDDRTSKIIGGTNFSMLQRLKKISTFVGDTTISNLVTQYQLDYVYGKGTARSTLHEIRQCGNSEGTIVCLTPTIFDWTGTQSLSSTQTTGFLNPYASMQLQNSNDEDWIWSGDFNADGMQDLMYVDDSYNWHLLPGSPTGFGERLNVKNISSGIFYDHDANWIWTGDMDGDGGTDLIFKGKSNNEWFYLTFKNGTVQVIYCGIPNYQPNDANRVWVSDLNGDGISDLSWIPKGSSTDKLYYSLTPKGGFPLNSHKSIQLKYDLYSENGEWVWPGDYNGDGNQDMLFRACGSKPNCYQWFISFGSNEGLTGPDSISGGFDFYDIPFTNNTGIAAWTGDFNGDGATDLFYSGSGNYMCMYYNNTKGMSTGWAVYNQFPTAEDHVDYTWTGDFNGDGYTDLIYQEGSGPQTPQVALTINAAYSGYPLWNGKKIAWQDNNIYTNHSQVQAWCMDVNGDGMSDFVVRDKTNTSTVYANLGTLEFPDVINKITDGLGGVISVDYEPMTNKEIYSADTTVSTNLESQGLYVNSDAYPYPEIPQNNSMLLVKSYSQNDGMGSTYSYSYKYQHAMMNMLGWGFLGFEVFTKTDHQTQRITQTIYNQDYPYNGKPDLIIVMANSNVQDTLASTGDTLFQHHFEYTVTSQNGVLMGSTSDQGSPTVLYSPGTPSTYQVALSNKWTDYYTYNTYEYSLGEQYFYDLYLNEIQIRNLGITNNSGDDLSPTDNVNLYKNYTNDVTKWILGTKINQGTSGHDQNGYALYTLTCGTTPSGIDKYYNVIAYSYDKFMNLETSCKYNDVSGEWLSTKYGVDGYGNKTRITDPAGNAITISYDNQYHTFHDKMTSPPNDNDLQLTLYFGYSPKFGTKLAHMDANGNVFIKSLDIHGRIQSKQGPVPDINGVQSSPNSLAKEAITGTKSSEFKNAAMVTLEKYSWGENSTIFHKKDKLQSWTKAGESPKNRYYYTYLDGMGRSWLSVKQGPNNKNIATYTQFNSDNQKVQQSLPIFTADNIIPNGSYFPFWKSMQYDIYKRVIQTTSPDGNDGLKLITNNISYPTQQKKIITYASNSSESYTQEFNYDFYNSKKKCTTTVIPADKNAKTTFDFDFLGRKERVTDPIGTMIGYYYDNLGRLIKREDPEQGDKSLHYGKNGKLEWMASFGKDTLRYSYDKLSRMTEELHYIGNSLSNEYSKANNSNSYTYDNPSIGMNGLGQQDAATVYDPQNSYKRVITRYGYDAYGRSNYTWQKTQTTIYAKQNFDPLGRQREYFYPRGTSKVDTLNSTYGPNGIYLESLSIDATQYASYSNYNEFERPNSIHYGNGTNTEFKTDPTGKVFSHIIKDPNQNVIINDHFTWDQLQRPTFIIDKTSSQQGGTGSLDYSQAFTYNTPGRLSTASGLYGKLSYDYDVGGNLTKKGETSYVYSNHQIQKGYDASHNEVYSATYDDKGNMTNQVVNNVSSNYGYDYANRLNYFGAGDINPTSKSPLFYYNHLGQMVYNDVNEQFTIYFDGMFESVLGRSQSQYSYKVKGPYGLVATVTGGNNPTTPSYGRIYPGVPYEGTVYYHQNYLNSTILTTDESGDINKANRLVYKPYGEVYQMDGANNFRPKFNGKELISGGGLYYFNARFYNPNIGRFITADTKLGGGPLQPDSRNPYAFGKNNPVTYSDPSGHSFSHWFKHHMKNIIGTEIGISEVLLGGLAMAAGQEQIGSALIGGGIAVADYSISSGSNFSWKGLGTAEAVGVISGVATAGAGEVFGVLADGAVSAGADAGADAAVGAEDGAVDGAADGTDDTPKPKESSWSAKNLGINAASGFVGSGTGYLMNNRFHNKNVSAGGFFKAAGIGAASGLFGGLFGGGVGDGFSSSIGEEAGRNFGNAAGTMMGGSFESSVNAGF